MDWAPVGSQRADRPSDEAQRHRARRSRCPRPPMTRASSSSAASGSTPRVAPTTSSTPPPRRSWGRHPTPRSSRRRRRRRGRPGGPARMGGDAGRGARRTHAPSRRGDPGQGARAAPTRHRGDRRHRRGGLASLQVPVAADRFERYCPRPPPRGLQTPLLPQVAEATPLAPGGLLGALAVRQPVGVVACITSYNFPLVNMAGKVAPALAMGNTRGREARRPGPPGRGGARAHPRGGGLARPAWSTWSTRPAPAPAVSARRVAGRRHGELHRVDEVGTRIAEAAGRSHEAPAARARAARARASSSTTPTSRRRSAASARHGASTPARSAPRRPAPWCTAGLRPGVETDSHGYAGALKVGDPTEPDTIVGPLISAVQRDRVERYIATARDEGGELVYGGGRPAGLGRGFYVRAHPVRRRQRHGRRPRGDLRAGRRGDPLRRRGGGHRHRQRQRLRALRLRLLRGHGPGASRWRSACGPGTWASTPPTQPRGALRRVQDGGIGRDRGD